MQTQVIIETDCSRVMSALKSLDTDKSEMGVVIAEAKGLTYLLGYWRVSQVKRDGNKVANALASLAGQWKCSEVRWEDAPACAVDCNFVLPS